MDAEGARALARRIREGPPSAAGLPLRREADSLPADVPGGRARCGVRIYRTERELLSVEGRTVLLVRRVCKTLVDGAWIVSVVREEFVDASTDDAA